MSISADDPSGPGEASARILEFHCDDCDLDFSAPPDGTGYDQAPCPQCQYVCISKDLIESDRAFWRRNALKLLGVLWPRASAGSGENALPRITILGLLQLTACLAFVIRFSSWRSAAEGRLFFATFVVLLESVILLSVPFGWTCRRRGYAFPSQPGEWLWLASGCTLLLTLLGHVVPAPWQFKAAPPLLANATILIFPIVASRVSIRWQLFFLLHVTLVAIVTFGPWLLGIDPWSPMFRYGTVTLGVIEKGMLVMALVIDRRLRERRLWTHWTGVGLFFLAMLSRVTAVVLLEFDLL